MNEVEQFFQCPHCLEDISMILDPTVDGSQSYVEDCEVCCKPIQVSFEADDGEILEFDASAN
ncbi:MAG: CPXCG motif-containing cysteine-rich protein [Bdellovibrionaceae bacterium]|nr:CPXCG motif-containing cysteine-rich protein [Pseudobdellovibrionaceae bacterium]